MEMDPGLTILRTLYSGQELPEAWWTSTVSSRPTTRAHALMVLMKMGILLERPTMLSMARPTPSFGPLLFQSRAPSCCSLSEAWPSYCASGCDQERESSLVLAKASQPVKSLQRFIVYGSL